MTRASSIFAVVCSFGSLPVTAQTFEVESVKPSQPGIRGSSVVPGKGGLRAVNATVTDLIETAFRVAPFQIVGGPSWLRTEGFDIDARAGSTVVGGQLRQMLKTLLVERFKLRFHYEDRNLPAYRLFVDKNGSKVAASGPGDCPDTESQDRTHPCGGFSLSARSHLYGEQVEMADLVEELQFALGRAIFDRTGLTGHYTIRLDWTPDETLFPGLGTERPDAPARELDGSSLFTALREQLGLKLESVRGPVPIIVIENAARPVAN